MKFYIAISFSVVTHTPFPIIIASVYSFPHDILLLSSPSNCADGRKDKCHYNVVDKSKHEQTSRHRIRIKLNGRKNTRMCSCMQKFHSHSLRTYLIWVANEISGIFYASFTPVFVSHLELQMEMLQKGNCGRDYKYTWNKLGI